MPVPDITARGTARGVGRIVLDALQHFLAGLCAFCFVARTLFTRQALVERGDKVGAGAQQHAANEVGCRDAWGALDDLEAAGLLDIAVAVAAIAVRSDVIAVDNILAAVVGNPGQRRNVGGSGNGLGCPSAGLNGGDTMAVSRRRAFRGAARRPTARRGALR